jgi:uncharacterized protein YpbB
MQTKTLLQAGMTAKEIAKTRTIAESTVWTHIEKLAEDKDVTLDDIIQLEPGDGSWKATRKELDAAINMHGTERLKALYEETGEQYDYNLIRLARIEYQLERG